MSDNLNFFKIEKFKDSVSVSNNQCLKYFCRQCVSSEDIIFTVHIGYDCLRGFHEARQQRMLIKTATLHLHSITEYFIACKVLHQGKRQIKDKLKDRGLTTGLRSIKKLQELFLNTLRKEKNINSMSLQYMYLFFQTV